MLQDRDKINNFMARDGDERVDSDEGGQVPHSPVQKLKVAFIVNKLGPVRLFSSSKIRTIKQCESDLTLHSNLKYLCVGVTLAMHRFCKKN